MSNDEFDKLKYSKTQFVEMLATFTAELIKEGKYDKNYDHENPFEKYVTRINSYTVELFIALDDIELIKSLVLELRPSVDKKPDEKVADLIRYHHENLILRVGKVKDLILILINEVLTLGLKKGSSLEREVIKRVSLSHPNFSKIWKYVKDALDYLKPYRNHLAHNGSLSLEELTMIKTFYSYPDYKFKNLGDEVRLKMWTLNAHHDIIDRIVKQAETHIINIELLYKMVFLFLAQPMIDKLNEIVKS